jgi:Legume lectin domain
MIKVVSRLMFLAGALASLCAADPVVIPLSSLQLNGNASLLSDGFIRFTRNTSQVSSAFVPTPYPLGPNDSFAALMVYNSRPVLGQCVADGIAFVAQNTPAGPGYLGLDGSGLGFFTETNSPAIGVTLDYYPNQITGTPGNAAAIAMPNGVDLVWTTPTPPALSGPSALRYVWVLYQNSSRTMQVYYNNTKTLPAAPLLQTTLPADLSSLFGGQVYFGVTAATGSCLSRQFLIYFALDIVNVP